MSPPCRAPRDGGVLGFVNTIIASVAPAVADIFDAAFAVPSAERITRLAATV